MRICFIAALAVVCASPAGCEVPRNVYGAHLLVDNTGARGMANLRWARNLVGKYGHVKTLMADITPDIKGAKPGWIDWVNECYRMDMIPVCRLAGIYSLGSGWIKPQADPDGGYSSMAAAVKRVVEDLPKSDTLPIYIEVWNEPNLDLEWSGKADLAEYARFFVEVSRAIRSIGDSRIVIMNGAFALSAESTEACCKAHPEFVNAFDVWASHPYPQNHPPEYNIHDGTAKVKDHTIDAYLLETAVLEKYGRKDVRVMITETGYALGEDLFADSEGFPPINEHNRADYVMRAFRDYWSKWPEIVAVLPFQFSDPGWTRFDWVDPSSDTRADGTPTKPHYQYTLVSKLAKPADPTGALSGKVRDSRFGVDLEDAEITLAEAPFSVKTDVMGNYIRPDLKPGTYNLTIKKRGFADSKASAVVSAGENSVSDIRLAAAQPGSIWGRVTDGVSGLPVGGARVSLTPGGAVATTDSTGRYQLADLPPVPYGAEAALEGHNSHEVPRIVIEPGDSVRRDFRVARSSWPAAKNECSNPSFELVNDPDGPNAIATRWEVQGPLGGRYEVVDGVSHSGDRSQAIYASGNTDWMLRMISTYGYSQPGATYTAGVWVKTEGVFKDGDGGAYLSLDFQSNDGATLHSAVSDEKVAGTRDWTYLEVTAVAPPSQRISVVLRLKALEGVAYFDDAYLALVKPAEQP